MTEKDGPGEPPEPLDFSPSSGATDPEHAAQDESEHVETGRHSYTENQTFIGGYLPSVAEQEDQWTDVEELPDKYKYETEDGEIELKPKWTSLNQANRDFYANENKEIRSEQRKSDYLNDIQTWGNQIELTEHEIQRATFIVERTDDQQRRRHGIDVVMLAAITLAANEGITDSKTSPRAIRPHIEVPEDSPIEQTPMMAQTYERIRNDLDVGPEQIRDARETLRELM